MYEQKSLSGDNQGTNLEELKLREAARISTAEDVKALLEAEFRGIAEIQQSQKLSNEEFRQIENLYWHKMGQNAQERDTSAAGPSHFNGQHLNGGEAHSTQQQQYRTFPGTSYSQYEEPQYSNSLRHEQKLKRHVLEEVVLEDSDKFYEKTLSKKVKKIDKGSSSGELRQYYYNQETLSSQGPSQEIDVDNYTHRHAKKQTEIIVGDRTSSAEEANRSYLFNKENVSTLPKEYSNKVYTSQDKQNEMLVNDVEIYKDKNSSLKLRNNFEREIEQSKIEKEKNRKSRLEGTESKIRSNLKLNQNEIVLDDKLLIEETQRFPVKKSHKTKQNSDMKYHTKISIPKFKSRFRKSKRSKKSKYDCMENARDVPILLSSRKPQEEIVLENMNTFSETTISKKKNFKGSTSSFEKSQNKLKAIDQDLYNQSIRCQSFEHKGPQKEIYLQGEEIVSETTLTRPKKYNFKKSKLNSEMKNLSKEILDSEVEQNEAGSSVVLTKVVHKEPQYTYETTQKDTEPSQQNMAVSGFYVTEENRKFGKKCRKSKSTSGKPKTKRSFFKKKKITKEIVIEDSEIFEDHNKPKNIHLVHGGMKQVMELDPTELPQLEEEQGKPEIENTPKKKKKEKKAKKSKSKEETILDKSFVYEDASRIGMPETSFLSHTTTVEEVVTESKVENDADQKGDAGTVECKPKSKFNILNIQEEKIVNDNYFVTDDTKFKSLKNRTSEEKTQDQMESKQKSESDEKCQKFKVKLPDIHFKRKSKQHEVTEEPSTSQHHETEVMPKEEAVTIVESTPVEIEVEKPQVEVESIVEESKPKESVEVKEKKTKFKFHLPDIHFNKPNFKKKVVEENTQEEKIVTDESKETKVEEKEESQGKSKFKLNIIKPSQKEKTVEEVPQTEQVVAEDTTVKEEIKTEKKEESKHKFNFHLPDIHIAKPSFKSKTVGEKIEIEKKQHVDEVQNQNGLDDSAPGATVETKIKTFHETGCISTQEEGERRGIIVNETILPTIQIEKDSKEVIIEEEKACTSEEAAKVVKAADEVVSDTQDIDQIDNSNKTSEDKKLEKSSNKKIKFSFPSFGRKNKDKQKKETALLTEIKSEVGMEQKTIESAVASDSKKEIVEEQRDLEKENIQVTEVVVVKPHVPPPPVFKKTEEKMVVEKTTANQTDKIQKDVIASKPSQEVTVDVSKSDSKSSEEFKEVKTPEEVIITKGKEITIIEDSSKPCVEITKEIIVVEPPKEINETIKEKDENVSIKKQKFNFPHFNIPKPNFSFRKNKEQKSDNDVSTALEEVIAPPEPSKEINDETVVLELPEVSVKGPEVPQCSVTFQNPESLKMDDVVLVEETKSAEPIVKPEVPKQIKPSEVFVSKPDLGIKIEQKNNEIVTRETIVLENIEQKDQVQGQVDENDGHKEVDEKGKSKKFTFNFHKPTFGKKSKEQQSEKEKDGNVVPEESKPKERAFDWTYPQKEITIREETLIEDSTKISLKPQKSIETKLPSDTVVESIVEKIPGSSTTKQEDLAVGTKTVNEQKKLLVERSETTIDNFPGKNVLNITSPAVTLSKEDDVESPKTKISSDLSAASEPSTEKVEETIVVTDQITTKDSEDDKSGTLKSEKDKKSSDTDKLSFMGKLRSNLPQICIQKSGSPDQDTGCLGKRNQEKIEINSKTVVAEDVVEKSKKESGVEKEPKKENTFERKKKNFFDMFHTKKNQKEKVYIVENDLSKEAPKGRFGRTKKQKKDLEDAQKKEKQGEIVVVGDTLVTETMKLSREGIPQGTDTSEGGRLSTFSQEGTTDTAVTKSEGETTKTKMTSDASQTQSNALEQEKSTENVQREAEEEKKKLFVDDAGNETIVNDISNKNVQTSTPVRPTSAVGGQEKEQTQAIIKNQKWKQSPNKNSAFFSTITASSQDDKKPLQFVVVAIDFGTTFSGYAFSFNRDLDSIHVMRKWEGGDPGVTNQKTPTILLLDPSGKFHSFGFTARDFYHDLSPKEAQKWMYFEKFKMALHYNADLTSETEIKAANGHGFKALDVFSHALKFFRNHAIQEIGEQSNTPIYEEDIKWVITVPAIWKSPAKQFMREAAYKAGIASVEKADRLLISLEPEAASVFVRKQRLKQLLPESADDRKDYRSLNKSQDISPPEHVENVTYHSNGDDSSSHNQSLSSAALNQSFQRSSSPASVPIYVGQEVDITDNRFMVADCGGGTADITVYEMLSATGGKLKELHKATGGPYGSIGVDLEFEKLLVSIFGADFIQAFKLKRPAGWVDLMMAFESRKRAATPFKSKPLNVPLPFSFIDYHKKHKNSTVEAALKKFNNKNVLWSSQGMLRLLPEAMEQLFQPTLEAIVKAIKEVISQQEVAGVNNIFMVGGFSESPMLQQAVRKSFASQSRILIPNDVSLTILKGAVLFGIDPSVVVIRKSRLTYGLGVLNRFIEGKHPESKRAMKDEESWCVDVFDPLVLADQSVALGSSVIRSYTPASSSQKFSLFHIYCSENRDVDFVTDEGVAKCGTLRLDLDDHQWDLESTPSRPVSQQISAPEAEAVEEEGARREIQARLTFGDTEIKLIALDVATGNYVRATLDFLNK